VRQLVSDAGEYIGKQQRTSEDKRRAEPVNGGESIVEVDNRDEQRDEFTQRYNQRYRQRRVLRRQNKHRPDTHISMSTMSRNIIEISPSCPVVRCGNQ